MAEFKSFDKIKHIGAAFMQITQKIHGSNAQILIERARDDMMPAECGYEDFNVYAGSRSRYITPDDDNYGFARFVMENREEFIRCLGEGRHFGEWAGPGINSGEGLSEKKLFLFNHRRWIGKDLPSRVSTVPLLYQGRLSLDAINDAMERLRTQGSFLVPGYMKPEGVVVEIDGQFYKNVFDAEEVRWKETTKKIKSNKPDVDISYLLQPLRLEKLLSRDEIWIREYPKNLGAICTAYVEDLVAESQFQATTEEELKAEKKALGRQIFYFVKSIVGAMQK